MIRWLYVSLECKEKIINEVRAREKFQLKWEKSYKIFIRDRFDNLIGTIVYFSRAKDKDILRITVFFFLYLRPRQTYRYHCSDVTNVLTLRNERRDESFTENSEPFLCGGGLSALKGGKRRSIHKGNWRRSVPHAK